MARILDLQYFSQEKTERATPKKRQESRKKGQVAKSADVNTAITLFVTFLCLSFMANKMGTELLALLINGLQNGLLTELTEESVQKLFVNIAMKATSIVAPVLGVALASGLLANFIQVGFLFSSEAIQLKLDRINPLQGFKRIYSIRALVELFKSLLKIILVGIITFLVLWNNKDQLLRLSHLSSGQSLDVLSRLTFQMGLYGSVLLMFLAFLDYLYQKFDFEKNIRMSKQEIKDEYKKSEGDPKIKSKIKEKQRQMAMRRMMQELPQADVIITNPTHYAIALKYDETKADAPIVIAKGMDYVAVKMKEIAKKHNVVAVENKPLARSLYARVDIGGVIPEDLFKAVAEILAYVYRLKKKY